MAKDKKNLTEQVALAEELQLLWLKRMKDLLDSGGITSTDMATLYRFLSDNGWSVDPSKLPTSLKDKLTSRISPTDFDNDSQTPRLKAI